MYYDAKKDIDGLKEAVKTLQVRPTPSPRQKVPFKVYTFIAFLAMLLFAVPTAYITIQYIALGSAVDPFRVLLGILATAVLLIVVTSVSGSEDPVYY